MHNWSVDEKRLKKFPLKYEQWKLEQQLSYGLEVGESINKKTLLKHWLDIKDRLDPERKQFIQFLLWS